MIRRLRQKTEKSTRAYFFNKKFVSKRVLTDLKTQITLNLLCVTSKKDTQK